MNSINEHIAFPVIYKKLKEFLEAFKICYTIVIIIVLAQIHIFKIFYSYNILDTVFINILKLKEVVATTKNYVWSYSCVAQSIHCSSPPDSIAELIFHDRFSTSHSALPLPSSFGHFLFELFSLYKVAH